MTRSKERKLLKIWMIERFQAHQVRVDIDLIDDITFRVMNDKYETEQEQNGGGEGEV